MSDRLAADPTARHVTMRLATFLRQPAARKRLVFEAASELAKAWWLVRLHSFRDYADRLGEPMPGEFEVEANVDPVVLRDITWAIGAVDRTVGERFTCLMQGIAGKAMLDRRGAENTLVLGARLGAGGDARPDGMAAHAWLRVGSLVLLGREGREAFAPVTSYHSPRKSGACPNA